MRHRPWTEAIIGNGIVLEHVDEPHEIGRRAPLPCAWERAVEAVHVDAAGEHVALGADHAARGCPEPSASSMAADQLACICPRRRGSGRRGRSPTTPTLPSRSKLAATDLTGDLLELLGIGLHRLAGEPQRVVVVARDHVHVEVEDRLPGGGLAGVEQVHAVGAEPVAHRPARRFAAAIV